MSALTQWYSEDEPFEEARACAPVPLPLQLADKSSARLETESAGTREWNVLASELVAYPPAHRRIFLEPGFFPETPAGATSRAARDGEPNRPRSYGERWLEKERARLQGLSDAVTDPGRPDPPDPPDQPDPITCPVPAERPGTHRARRASIRRDTRAAAQRPTSPAGAALTEPRGLRRLLPGVATLAVLVGLWVGTSALSEIHHPSTARLPGSVPTAHGYLYTARPGDTLWSIAEAVQPNGDPRVLVDRLEQQLNGRPLVAGDRLLLP